MVVIPPEVREAIAEHARAELPNEMLRPAPPARRRRRASSSRARNTLASPYRFELEVDPELWFVEIELRRWRSSTRTRRPSRSRRRRTSRTSASGQGRPYLIYSVARDELAAWQFVDGAFEPLELA